MEQRDEPTPLLVRFFLATLILYAFLGTNTITFNGLFTNDDGIQRFVQIVTYLNSQLGGRLVFVGFALFACATGLYHQDTTLQPRRRWLIESLGFASMVSASLGVVLLGAGLGPL